MPVLPDVNKCCGCVTDLKTAVAIIAVIGIVTSPVVSWAVVRHSYVIRMSCFVTTSAQRADVVDINLNNILSFGFGANAGLGPSCLGPKKKPNGEQNFFRQTEYSETSGFINTIRWVGWIVLIADIVFVGFSIYLLFRLFRPPETTAIQRFLQTCVIAVVLSFIYGMLYVAACVSVGGSFPVFEFIFCLVDVMMWAYFLIVVNSYSRKGQQMSTTPTTTTTTTRR